MGLAAATLGGNRITDASWTIPAWGASWADVSLDVEVTLSGRVTLTVADLTAQCTVISGGPGTGRSFYRVVAGAGGWGKVIGATSYADDFSVKLSKVLGDAASACGETIDASSFTDRSLGAYWTRPNDQACRVLEQLSPNAWFVGEDGKTRLGSRPSTKLAASAAVTSQVDLARGTVTIASETIATILPGVVVNGITAVDVEHTIDAKGGLRSQIWGKQGTGLSRRLAALRAILLQLDPDRAFRGLYEYRIVTQTGNRLNLQPVRVSTGMPSLSRVRVLPGIPGASAKQALGARCVVGFLNADPTQPIVVGFDDADSDGFLPQSLSIGGTYGVPGIVVPTTPGAAARVGDSVGPFLITKGSGRVTIGG